MRCCLVTVRRANERQCASLRGSVVPKNSGTKFRCRKDRTALLAVMIACDRASEWVGTLFSPLRSRAYSPPPTSLPSTTCALGSYVLRACPDQLRAQLPRWRWRSAATQNAARPPVQSTVLASGYGVRPKRIPSARLGVIRQPALPSITRCRFSGPRRTSSHAHRAASRIRREFALFRQASERWLMSWITTSRRGVYDRAFESISGRARCSSCTPHLPLVWR